ncbi:hypothetical protein JIN85_15835 [Luteolibacter pohnpeiensis]|uniref:Peptidase M56 domain-containing protein n=1 Tax=Luteolibacter pohnpeiensis TaxID=454153 RepID=A0A934S9T4_9BACT|nr:M56 family metallopeptidase [Luteolibacter pohnpeiensis]MBK1883889.1 hypothetical protein [Luteolibacter pohnpeiensis]
MNLRLVLVGSASAASFFLHALDGIAKVGLLLALAALVAVCLRRASAAQRHLVWVCALVGAILLPFGYRILPAWKVLPSWMRWEEAPRLLLQKPAQVLAAEPSKQPAEILNVEELLPADDVPEAGFSTAIEPKTPASVASAEPKIFRVPVSDLIGVWFVGAAVLAVPLGISSMRLRRKKSKAHRLDSGPLFEICETLKADLCIRRRVTILLGDAAQMPMVWGIFRPVVLLPEKAQTWPDERIRAVLLHELSHLRRNDPLALWIAHLALALHWFNPLAWWAVRQLRIEQENACDDAVLRHGVRSSDYAAQMLELGADFSIDKIPTMALGMARSSGLDNRICGLLDPTKNRRAASRLLMLGFATLAVFVGGPLAMLRAGEPEVVVRGRILDRNGLVLAESSGDQMRQYPHGKAAAHQIGWVSPRFIGVSGAEKNFDQSLAAGNDVRLTLDLKAQQIVETAIQNAGVERGAVVVLDCRNGEVLASTSVPEIEPQQFVPQIEPGYWKKLSKDPNQPLLDQTTAKFVQGATYSLVAAVAAARTGQGEHAVFDCTGSLSVDGAKINCWIKNSYGNSHGPLGLRAGIANACNCYRSQLAMMMGQKELDIAAEVLGLEKISSQAGDENPISQRSLALVGIGQVFTRASPQQLAVLAAAIGNGGKVWVPRVALDEPPQLRADLVKLGWNQRDLATIRLGMEDCVNASGGTGQSARSDLVKISGKTGTGLIMDRGRAIAHAWFIGYAPAENPRYAVAVMAQGSGAVGRVRGPIARAILEALCLDAPESR